MLITCQKCKGSGILMISKNQTNPPCPYCLGTKTMNTEWIEKGRLIKEQRIKRKMTCHQAAKYLNINYTTLSRMELGRIPPENISYGFPMKYIKLNKEN